MLGYICCSLCTLAGGMMIWLSGKERRRRGVVTPWRWTYLFSKNPSENFHPTTLFIDGILVVLLGFVVLVGDQILW